MDRVAMRSVRCIFKIYEERFQVIVQSINFSRKIVEPRDLRRL